MTVSAMPTHLRSRHSPPSRARSRAARVVLACVAVAQLLTIGLAAFADARPSSTIGAHVEATSKRQHYVHDEAHCAACVVRQLVSAPPRVSAGTPAASASEVERPEAARLPVAERRRAPSSPRAPPRAS